MRTPDLTPEAARELAAIDDALAGRPVDPELTELGELALALRDERPEMPADLAHSLDARTWGIEEGRRRRRGWTWGFAPAFAASALLALVVSVAVLTDTGGDDESGGNSSAGGLSAPVAEDARDLDDSSGSGSGSGGGGSVNSRARRRSSPAASSGNQFSLDSAGSDRVARRKVEQSALLTIAVRPRDVDSTAAEIMRVTNSLGGFVRSSSVTSSRSGGSGHFELRIPTARLERGLAQLSKLGRVRERSQTSQDITGAFVSARQRLTDARAERRALLRALARATTANEVASLRARLRLVAQEIARAARDLQQVDNRVNYSTVAVTLVGDRDLSTSRPDDGSEWTPGDALRDAGRILEVAVGVALVALAVLLPLGLVALAAALAARSVRRRRRERALDAA